MCGVCSALMSSHWAEAEESRRDRIARTLLLQRILDHFGLGVWDWGGRTLLLRDRKGKTVVVADVGRLWVEAEKLAGRPLDPLDPGLVAALAPLAGDASRPAEPASGTASAR